MSLVKISINIVSSEQKEIQTNGSYQELEVSVTSSKLLVNYQTLEVLQTDTLVNISPSCIFMEVEYIFFKYINFSYSTLFGKCTSLSKSIKLQQILLPHQFQTAGPEGHVLTKDARSLLHYQILNTISICLLLFYFVDLYSPQQH